ncbi:MAG: carbon storage regulator CsrA [Rhodothermales bacterium]|nr:carbon storage regulator CsrA [Rhodothermales bacterium]
MLILSRRIDESIQIGGEITVTILDIKGNKVRIGISAPDDVTVHRDEIYERVQVSLGTENQRESDQKYPAPNRRRNLGLFNAESR